MNTRINPAWCLVAFVFPLLLFITPLVTAETFFYRDVYSFFFPMKHFLAQQVKQGNVPLWNPYLSCGTPFLADMQSGFFYPISLVFYCLPFYYAFKLFVIIHYSLGCLFFFIMLRSFKCSSWASFLGAMLFTWGGYMVSMQNTLNNLQSIIWIPLLVYNMEKYLLTSNKRYLVASMVVAAIQITGGEMLVVVLTYIFLGGIVLTTTHKVATRKLIISFILVIMVGSTLAAVQVIPGMELTSLSQRAGGFSRESASFMSIEPITLINFFYPRYFFESKQPGTIFPEREIPWILSIYCGVVGLFFFMCIFLTVFSPRAVFLLIMFMMGLTLGLGKYTPVYGWVYSLFTLFQYFRIAEKFFLFSAISFPILAAFGWDKFWVSTTMKKRVLTFLCITIFLVSFMLLSSVIKDPGSNLYQLLVKYYPSGNIKPYLSQIISTSLKSLNRSILILALLATLTGILCIKNSNHTLLKFLYVLLCLIDLFLAHRYLPAYADGKNFTMNQDIVSKIKLPTYNNRVFTSNRESVPREADIFEYYLSRFRLLVPNVSFYLGYYDANEKDVLTLRTSYVLQKFVQNSPDTLKSWFLNMMGVKYFFSFQEFHDPNWVELLKIEDEPFYVYENKLVPIRLFTRRGGILVDSMDEMMTMMVQVGLKHEPSVVVSKEILGVKQAPGDPIDGNSVNNSFKFLEYEPSRVKISGTMPSNGVLLFTDSYYNGWKAFNQTGEIPIIRANYSFRALQLKKGKHHILFVYLPYSFQIGLYMSLFTFMLVIGWASCRFPWEIVFYQLDNRGKNK